jgi:hypothetical protein
MTLPGLLLTSILSVTHAPGWSDPIISIEEPSINTGAQRKDIEVTDGNHIHQIWDTYQSLTRVGYNIVVADGTVLSPDTMISRNVFSGYLSSALIGTDFFGVWRENSPIWFAVNDHTGEAEIPATLFTSTPWSWWWYIAADGDSLGRVHMTYDTPGGIWYSIMIPGQPPVEVFRDTIPQSRGYTLLDVDGDRVHVLYKSSADWMPRYVQYDLDGNQTLGPIEFIDPSPYSVDNRWSLCSDDSGNACVFMKNNADSAPLLFFRIDRNSGELLVDGRVIVQFVPPSSVDWPLLEPGPWDASLHLLWLEEDDNYGPYPRLIRHAIIDLNGNFIVEPYTAYDYTDEDPENISYMVAASNEEGDLFVAYSEGDPSLPGYWIRLGWLDHNYLGVEDQEEGGGGAAPLSMNPSCNPFNSSLTIACEGDALPGQLMVYDITGRLVRSLSDREGSSFTWDGRDASGAEVPTGTYLIQGAVDGQVSSIRVVRL